MLRLRAWHALEWPAEETPRDPAQLLAETIGEAPRRISRFDALALAGAALCRRAAGELDPGTALYLCCEQPNVHDTAQLLRQVIREGGPVKPFQFVNVSSNMTGFRVAQLLGIGGANLTLCRSDASLEAALELALPAAAGAVLIGYVEACAWPLADHRRRLRLPPEAPLAECSHWLYFDRGAAAARLHLECCLRFADAGGAAAGLPAQCRGGEFLATGPGIAPGEARLWLERLGLREVFEPAAGGYSRGRGARVLCDFAERGRPGRLLYLDRTGRGEYYATLAALSR